jgi:hypothetical protein
MAGFVLEDSRFTKASQDPAKQAGDVEHAFEADARCVPLYISDARLKKLRERTIVSATQGPNADVMELSSLRGGTTFNFRAVRTAMPPAGCTERMWGIYYGPNERPEQAKARKVLAVQFPMADGLTPVMGMVNPDNAEGKLGAKSAVAGDYDLWCVFPHSAVRDHGINDRSMPLRAELPKSAAPLLHQRAQQAGLVFKPGEKNAIAGRQEDKHLGNISLGVMKIRGELNAECRGTGYTAGNLVQHSDYGGNPFGTIDYPLIFFIPTPPAGPVDVAVATDLPSLKDVLRTLTKLQYNVKLNPAWSVPNY